MADHNGMLRADLIQVMAGEEPFFSNHGVIKAIPLYPLTRRRRSSPFLQSFEAIGKCAAISNRRRIQVHPSGMKFHIHKEVAMRIIKSGDDRRAVEIGPFRTRPGKRQHFIIAARGKNALTLESDGGNNRIEGVHRQDGSIEKDSCCRFHIDLQKTDYR